MWTKSKIQLIKESIAMASDYEIRLENIMDKYTIEDSVFVYNGRVQEVTQGYFVEKDKYNTIREAINACGGDYMNNGIRILNNKEYIVGDVKKNLSECIGSQNIFDINALTNVR